MRTDAFGRGANDYYSGNPCTVYRTVRGTLVWNGDPESNGLPTAEEQDEWAEAYIAGFKEAEAVDFSR